MRFRSLIPAMALLGIVATSLPALADTAPGAAAQPVKVAQATQPACVPAQSPVIPLGVRITAPIIDNLAPNVVYGASVRESCLGTAQQVTYGGVAVPFPGSWWISANFPAGTSYPQWRGNP
jgi:hypothetical protein